MKMFRKPSTNKELTKIHNSTLPLQPPPRPDGIPTNSALHIRRSHLSSEGHDDGVLASVAGRVSGPRLANTMLWASKKGTIRAVAQLQWVSTTPSAGHWWGQFWWADRRSHPGDGPPLCHHHH